MQIKNRRRIPVLAIALATAAVIGLAGCSAGSSPSPSTSAKSSGTETMPASVIKAAKAEGSLTIYTSNEQKSMAVTAQAFQSQYGIKVNVVRTAAQVAEQKFTTEISSDSPTADILLVGDNAFYKQQTGANVFLPLSEKDEPNFAAWPTKYRTSEWIVSLISPLGIAYNTSAVSKSDVPTSWKDILKAKYKGKIMAADPRAIPAYLAVYNYWLDNYGPSFLTSFKNQNPQRVSSTVSGSQQVVAGEKDFLLPNLEGIILPLVQQGAPIAMAQFKDTIGSEVGGAISIKAPHKAAAKLFMNWIMSKTGQANYSAPYKAASPIKGVPGTIPLPAGYTSPNIVEAQNNLNKIVQLLGLGS